MDRKRPRRRPAPAQSAPHDRLAPPTSASHRTWRADLFRRVRSASASISTAVELQSSPQTGSQRNVDTVADDLVRVPCNLCGSPNRLPAARLGQSARCGHCGSPLMTGSIAAVRASRLDRIVESSDLAVVVQVASERVPAERRRDDALEGLAGDLKGTALVYRVDADRDPEALDALGLSAVPSLAVAVGGEVVSGLSGGLDRAALDEWLALRALDALHS